MKQGDIFEKEGVLYMFVDENTCAKVKEIKDGVTILETVITTKDDGIDKEGNPIKSVNISIPTYILNTDTGKIGG